jgi:hypothetical protein
MSQVRWSLKVSAETDIELRTYLAQLGTRKGDLSKFVEQAVHRDLLLRTMDAVHERNAASTSEEIEAAIGLSVLATRAASGDSAPRQ